MTKCIFSICFLILFITASYAQTLKFGFNGSLIPGESQQPVVNSSGDLVRNTEKDWSLITLGGSIRYELGALPIGLGLRVSYGKDENILTAEEPFLLKKTTDLSLLQFEMLAYYQQHLFGSLGVNFGFSLGAVRTNFKTRTIMDVGDIVLETPLFDNKDTKLSTSALVEVTIGLLDRVSLSVAGSYRFQSIDHREIFLVFDENLSLKDFMAQAELRHIQLSAGLFFKI